jgi:hypothetical protein
LKCFGMVGHSPSVGLTWSGAFQDVVVGNGNAAEHRSHDAEESLVRAADVKVFEPCASILKFDGCPVNRTAEVTCETGDGAGGEAVAKADGCFSVPPQ